MSALAMEIERLQPLAGGEIPVDEGEYRRLLGYPRGSEPGERAVELAEAARAWYGANGRPWTYWREVAWQPVDREDAVRIEGIRFDSPGLAKRLRDGAAERLMIGLASAGAGCEERARQLWHEEKPDEYFFLESFGSAVVEALVSRINGEVCAFAETQGLTALRHYSPGYVGWDVADQMKLFEVLQARLGHPLPEPVSVLPSGMLVPRKALLAVLPLTAGAAAQPQAAPCTDCSFSPCAYRRPPAYTVNVRALRKWARDRVTIRRTARSIVARFRFEGTTCSNLGHPLAFDYELELAAEAGAYTLHRAACRPAPGDEGHRKMCAYLSDADGLMAAIAAEAPRAGQSLDAALAAAEPGVPAGCHCTAAGRTHKWSLALQAIHYALQAPSS